MLSISALGIVEPINFSECVTVELNYEKVTVEGYRKKIKKILQKFNAGEE